MDDGIAYAAIIFNVGIHVSELIFLATIPALVIRRWIID